MQHWIKINQTVIVDNVIHSPGETVLIDNDQRARYLIDTGAGAKIEQAAGIPVTVNVSITDTATVQAQSVKPKKSK
jgi:hypothetical protein